jgi:hypothetical protein
MNRIWKRLPEDIVTSVLRYMDIETRIAFKIIGRLPEIDLKLKPKKITHTPFDYSRNYHETSEIRWNLPNQKHILYSRTLCPSIGTNMMNSIEIYEDGVWTTIWAKFVL